MGSFSAELKTCSKGGSTQKQATPFDTSYVLRMIGAALMSLCAGGSRCLRITCRQRERKHSFNRRALAPYTGCILSFFDEHAWPRAGRVPQPCLQTTSCQSRRAVGAPSKACGCCCVPSIIRYLRAEYAYFDRVSAR